MGATRLELVTPSVSSWERSYNDTNKSAREMFLHKYISGKANMMVVQGRKRVEVLRLEDIRERRLHHSVVKKLLRRTLDVTIQNRVSKIAELNRSISAFRSQLKPLEESLKAMEKAWTFLQLALSRDYSMPGIPAYSQATDLEKEPVLPAVSGIYFLWQESEIFYVGQSTKLSHRCVLSHDAIKRTKGKKLMPMKVSYLPFAEKDLDFAEAYYIWLARPRVNFGAFAKCLDAGRPASQCKTSSLLVLKTA